MPEKKKIPQESHNKGMATRQRQKTGPQGGAPVPQAPLSKEDREKRNYLIYARFLAGYSEREIGRAVGISGQRVHVILQQELKNAARHHKLLTDQALEMYVARLETLLRSVWPKVQEGDVKAVETARHIMEQQSRLYGLDNTRIPAMPMGEQILADESNPTEMDELTQFRMKHRKSAG